MVCVESGNVGPDKITLSSASRAILKVELSSEALG
jgi:D-hexose-6-phosphate mutarotase